MNNLLGNFVCVKLYLILQFCFQYNAINAKMPLKMLYISDNTRTKVFFFYKIMHLHFCFQILQKLASPSLVFAFSFF